MITTNRMYFSLPSPEQNDFPSASPSQVILLDGTEMKDKTSAHAYLAQSFGFPSWYGQNLDALWDMLTTWGESTVLFRNAHLVPLLLGGYGSALLDIFREAAEENPRLHLHFEEE